NGILEILSGELRAFCGEDLKDSIDQGAEVVVGANFKQWRHEARIQPEGTGFHFLDIGNAQHGTAFARLIFREKAEILTGDLDWLFTGARVVVAHVCYLGKI